jgi:hypothetical protein
MSTSASAGLLFTLHGQTQVDVEAVVSDLLPETVVEEEAGLEEETAAVVEVIGVEDELVVVVDI